MPIVTSFIRNVYPVTHGRGTRFEVSLAGTGPFPYTWDPLKASLCERAAQVNRAVVLATRETSYGFEIVSVNLVPEPAQEVA